MVDHFPPSKHFVVIRDFPVANSCPIGHENVITVPKAVSLFDAKAPIPEFRGGQSENKIEVSRCVSLCLFLIESIVK